MCGPRLHTYRKSFAIDPITDRTTEHEEGKIQCFECGKLYDKEIRYCSECGAEIRRCPISKMPFRTGEKFAQCPSCFALFHFHHLKDWIQNGKDCPMCRKPIISILSGYVGNNFISNPSFDMSYE